MLSDLEADKYGLSMAPWPWVSSWLVQWGAPAADQIQGKVNLKIHSPFPWAPILCRVTVGWICPLSEATAPAQWPSPHSVFLGLSNCILYSFLESYVRKWFLVAVTNPDTLWCFVVSLHPFIILFSNAPISLFFLFFFSDGVLENTCNMVDSILTGWNSLRQTLCHSCFADVETEVKICPRSGKW